MRRSFLLALVAALAAAGSARADDPAVAPWAAGVSDEQKARAQALLEAGNALFLESKHREALARYQEAIAAWDHPAIRFNVVRSLVALDRPVEAFDNLELALRYGAAPLEEQVYLEAKNYLVLLRGQIAELEVRCDQRGARVALDGERILTCPGSTRLRVRPGAHQLVGDNEGYLPATLDLKLVPGATETVDVRLVSLDEATVTTRRWAAWKPWAVVAGGVAVAGIGGLFHASAAADLDAYDRAVAVNCVELGCDPATDPRWPAIARYAEDAERKETIAVGAYVVGGAAVLAGVLGVVLNTPRAEVPHPVVTGVGGRGGVGLAVGGVF